MKKQLITYVNSLFENVSDNEYSRDLHDEICADLTSIYDECIGSGMSQAGAYAEAIRSLGDVDSLIEDVNQQKITVRSDGSLFSESGIVIQGKYSDRMNFGAAFEKILMFINPTNEKILQSAFNSLLWIIITILYFVISFLTGWWHITWLIFLVGASLCIAGNLVFDIYRYRMEAHGRKSEKKLRAKISGAFSGILWLSATIAYIVFSFTFGGWAFSWLIFLLAAIVQVMLSALIKLSAR